MKLEVGMYCYDKCNRELGIGKILTEPRYKVSKVFMGIYNKQIK